MKYEYLVSIEENKRLQWIYAHEEDELLSLLEMIFLHSLLEIHEYMHTYIHTYVRTFARG